jgi:methyl-accepting chemotaxis protein
MMAMTFLATWFQDSDMANSLHTMSTFMGILAISVAVLTLLIVIGGAVVAVQVLKAVKRVTSIATDLQGKATPIIQEVAVISRHTREMLEDAKPKIASITDNLARTSATLSETAVTTKATVEKLQATVTDANARTQRQVARVDGMVSAALNTTAEVVESINNGIRVPAQKIAQAATQARIVAEGLIDRVKGMAGNMPFGGNKQASRPAYSSAASGGTTYRSPSSGSSSSPSTPSKPSGTSYAAAPKAP